MRKFSSIVMSVILCGSFAYLGCERRSEAVPPKHRSTSSAEIKVYEIPDMSDVPRSRSQKRAKSTKQNYGDYQKIKEEKRPKGRRGKRSDEKKSKQTKNEATNRSRKSSV